MIKKKPVSVKGLVFDMDGLLLDSEKVVKRSWDYAGKELGYENFGDLKACKSIGIEPEDAVALEDAPSGAISAHAAGMRVIVVPDLVQPPEEVKQFLWKQAEDLERVIEMIWG